METDSLLAVRLYRQLLASDFKSISLNEPGNFTCFLELREGDTSHEIAWPEWERAKLPQGILEVYQELTGSRESGT